MSYCRFSAYRLAFEQPQHSFPNDVTFQQIRLAHKFDMELRDLVTEAIDTV